MNFEHFYNAYFNTIFAYIRCKCADTRAAEEISCAVWQKVYKNFNSYDKNKGVPEQWLFTIARNEANSFHRFQKIRSFISLDFFEDIFAGKEKDGLQIMQEEERSKKLLAALSKLPQRERDLISLKFYSSFNNREIADMTGLSESNIGTILNRSMSKLRELLGDLYE